MEALGVILPIVVYFLLIILLVIVIILGIKLIITLDKINKVADNIQEKIDSLNHVFGLVNFASEKLGYLSNKIIDSVLSVVNKIFGLKNGKDDDEDYV